MNNHQYFPKAPPAISPNARDYERQRRLGLACWPEWKSWTIDERIVWSAIVTMKSHARVEEAQRATGITGREYEIAKADLVRRGILNKNGAAKQSYKRSYRWAGVPIHLNVAQRGGENSRAWMEWPTETPEAE